MIITVGLSRDLLLNEICSQRTRRVGASGGYIILSSSGHRGGRFGMKEVLLHSSTGDVGAEGRAEADTRFVMDESVAVGCKCLGAVSDLTRSGCGHELYPERRLSGLEQGEGLNVVDTDSVIFWNSGSGTAQICGGWIDRNVTIVKSR